MNFIKDLPVHLMKVFLRVFRSRMKNVDRRFQIKNEVFGLGKGSSNAETSCDRSLPKFERRCIAICHDEFVVLFQKIIDEHMPVMINSPPKV